MAKDRFAAGEEDGGLAAGSPHPRKRVHEQIVEIVSDSGEGAQKAGQIFGTVCAKMGNGVWTVEIIPAEIKPPARSRAGASGIRIRFGDHRITNMGDEADLVIAFNEQVLYGRIQQRAYRPGTVVLLESRWADDSQEEIRQQYAEALEDFRQQDLRVIELPLDAACDKAVDNARVGKNMFILGLLSQIFGRDLDKALDEVRVVFGRKGEKVVASNLTLVRAGWEFAAEKVPDLAFEIPPVETEKDLVVMNGNQAAGLGIMAAGIEVVAMYPITPATSVSHFLASAFPAVGGIVHQAEDEIAAIGFALGASYAGKTACTITSGPGLALKTEFLGLAVMAELPVVIVNVQRGGPSTGLPTKTEQSDLLQAIHGRNGECPVAVLAAHSPAHCFEMAIEAFRIAIRYMTPVFLLSDGSIANGTEPWRTPEESELPAIDLPQAVPAGDYQVYARDPATLARQWVAPGTPGLEHCLGGLEKQDISGKVSHDSANHQRMVQLRMEKIRGIAKDIPELTVFGPAQGDLLVLGWGGTFGAIHHAVERAQRRGLSVAASQLDYLNPFPANLGSVLRSYRQILIPELNAGQLRMLIRAQFLVDAAGLNKITGQPFRTSEIEQEILRLLGVQAGNRGDSPNEAIHGTMGA